jgi:hypothetical protein
MRTTWIARPAPAPPCFQRVGHEFVGDHRQVGHGAGREEAGGPCDGELRGRRREDGAKRGRHLLDHFEQVRLLGASGVDLLVDIHEAAHPGDGFPQPGGKFRVRFLEGLHLEQAADHGEVVAGAVVDLLIQVLGEVGTGPLRGEQAVPLLHDGGDIARDHHDGVGGQR